MSAETIYQFVVIAVPIILAIVGIPKLMIDQNNKKMEADHAENIRQIDAKNAENLKAFELKASEQTAEAARLAQIAATAAEQVRLQGEQKKAELGLLADMVKSMREMNTNRTEENKATTAERITNAATLSKNTDSATANTAALITLSNTVDANQQKSVALSQAVTADGSATRDKLDQTNTALREIETSLKQFIDIVATFGTEYEEIRASLEVVRSKMSNITLKTGETVAPAQATEISAPESVPTEQPAAKTSVIIEGTIETKGDTAP